MSELIRLTLRMKPRFGDQMMRTKVIMEIGSMMLKTDISMLQSMEEQLKT